MKDVLLMTGAYYGPWLAVIVSMLTVLWWMNIPMIVLSIALWVGSLVCAQVVQPGGP